MDLEWILFDCMETLVDLEPVPETLDYAAWAFDNSGVESYWADFEQFHTLFVQAIDALNETNCGYEEWSSLDRFKQLCSMTPGLETDRIDSVSEKLQNQFQATYLSKCYVHKDVAEILPELARSYKLGVVSNFKIANGIQEILEKLNLLKYFQWVLTSSEIGWRKPHPSIYQAALKMTGVTASNVLFVGDNLENDISTPLTFGMSTLLLDRHQQQNDIEFCDRVTNFYELQQLLQER